MRLLTRSDFDGLVCAALLVEAGVVDEYKFVHPKDIQDGSVEVTKNDVLANVPYAPGCGLWFDHHSSEAERLALMDEFHFEGESRVELSCARVIYDYYGGAEKFAKFEENGLMEAVDKCDSGQLSKDEIMTPEGWVLLSFIMDPRTGLARYRDYRIANYQLMEELIEACRYKRVEEILTFPDVQERIQRYYAQEKAYEEMILEHSRTDGNVLIIDLHEVEEILTGNRFKEYVLFPDQNISVRVIWGKAQQNMVFTCGHSIFNRTSKTDIGALMLKFGGGGHWFAGTCQVPTANWEHDLQVIIEKMKADG